MIIAIKISVCIFGEQMFTDEDERYYSLIFFDLLLEKEYDNVSISDIRQVTGIAGGLLYHFGGIRIS